METKTITVPFEMKNLHEDEDFFTFEGFAATFGNIDRGNDRIIRGAFLESIEDLKSKAVPIRNTEFHKLMPILWQHDPHTPIGSFIEIREDHRGLFVKGIMPKSDTFVTGRVMPQIDVSSISDMSIGFRIEDLDIINGVRELKKIKLFETSLVTIPMNEEANITAFKSVGDTLPLADRKALWDEEDAAARVGDDEKAYLFVDEAGESKFLIADLVDGKLIAVPEAIFKAAAYLRMFKVGASDERAKKITKYYKEMGLDSPFQKSYLLGENEANTLTQRQFEKFLFASNALSKGAAKLIASKFKPVVRDADSEQSVRDAAHKEGGAMVVTLEQIANLFKKENPNDRGKQN